MNLTENDVTIYCDDKPIGSLPDFELPTICADDIPDYISGNSGSLTFCAKVSDNLDAIFFPTDILVDLGDIIKSIEAVCKEHPKWQHFWLHSKRARTRQKYQKRIYRLAFGG